MRLITTSALRVQRWFDVPASELRRPLINRIQLQIGRINTNGSMDGQRKLEFIPSLCEDADELEKSPFPDGPGKDFDEDLFPATRSQDTGN